MQLIIAGFFVCLDSFLSLLTIMPARIAMAVWRVLNTRWNLLQIFDKLCQSFGEDVLQVLFDSAEGLSTCPPDNMKFELIRFILDETIAVIAFDILCHK
ncbi:hypothetical protein BHM03_00023098 [Ensete ventricosum]|nr:hypothetical protein BHM03_00023098 [Ensete ventricosum]